MRVVGEIPHPLCKITILSWNNRYLIKIESGMFEQTFKINQFDIFQETDLNKLLDETFIKDCLSRFEEMNKSLHSALGRLE
jgi:hypothetical protein